MRRGVIVIVMLLTAGAVINVGVAWGCVYWIHGDSFDLTRWGRTPTDWLVVSQESQFGWDLTYAWTVSDDDLELADAEAVTARPESVASGPRPQTETMVLEWAAGAPCRSMLGWLIDPWGDWEDHWLQTVRGRPMPLRPLWPGFAINTVFYAGVVWLLLFLSLTVRRVVRHHRDLCPKCAYNLAGTDACPECGWNQEPAGNSSQSHAERTE